MTFKGFKVLFFAILAGACACSAGDLFRTGDRELGWVVCFLSMSNLALAFFGQIDVQKERDL